MWRGMRLSSLQYTSDPYVDEMIPHGGNRWAVQACRVGEPQEPLQGLGRLFATGSWVGCAGHFRAATASNRYAVDGSCGQGDW